MRYTLSILAIAGLAACSPEEPNEPALSVPSTYEFTRNNESTVAYGGQIDRQAMMAELSTTMKGGVDNALDYDMLVDMYENQNNPFADADLNTSGKSLSSKTSASPTHTFDQGATINYFKGWMQAAVTASENPATAADGVAGVISNSDNSKRYLVDERGVEYVQVIEKGLMGAIFMDQMVNNYLTPAKLDVENDATNADPYTSMEHHWDEAYGYFTLVQDLNLDPSVSQERGYWGRYIVGLENNFGLASDMYYAFRKGRAAIVAKDYDSRDEVISTITDGMEQTTYLKALGYLNKGATALNSGEAAVAFHALSEGVGFIYSLRYIASEKVTAAQSDAWIETLIQGNGFWSGDIQTRIETVKTAIGNTFNLSEAIVDGSH
ncbi:DUF4856 domain-containing protein [Phaeocystidibacter luteus]|uniref:DUF4856 domain-containing protein n=1 Tax=Phaeocystidibacter luteus TaxID=911197 RepID=A0A6N6RFA8_9FLAO|nr:DUF4856 domain-containing protein [Phaeocystidibacter luteus]KAB2805380.1 DUF4856 domain-containing protein [Phaeocystidibacter luteus]